MAEYLARHELADAATWSSAGTMAIPDDHATQEAIGVMAALGIDMTPHRATNLDDAQEPTLVFGMELSHLVAARRRFPDIPAGDIRLLDHPKTVPDPYGRGIEAYRTSLAQISEALRGLDLG